MKKEDFKKCYWLRQNVIRLEARVEELESKAHSLEIQYSDMPGSGGSDHDKMTNAVAAIVEIKGKLQWEIARCNTMMVGLENAIKALPEREKYLMRARYYDALAWEKICVEMGYSWRQIHNIHSAILQKIADI